MYLYNSLTRQKEEFTPIKDKQVAFYTCGMTVYDYAHIGHGRKYVNDDVLRRTLQYLGYEVKHVQNVTDVGHLVSDEDAGEDKLEKGARKFGKSVWEVADFFTKDFYESNDKLNILRPHIICKATDHIPEQIELVKSLIDRGLAYETKEAVYFDVTKFPNYGKIFGQKLEDKKTAVRDEVQEGEHKKHPADFALWFKRVHRFADHVMHWKSPWADGFPGWHIECSAMSLKYLGNAFDDKGKLLPSQTQTIDIHTGGIEHLPIHHPNEIAQSEGATGHTPFVKYWVHYNHLLFEGQKMSKSLGNFYRVQDIEAKEFDPLALRYFYFSAHYRHELNFTWQALRGAQTVLNKLRDFIRRNSPPYQEPVLDPIGEGDGLPVVALAKSGGGRKPESTSMSTRTKLSPEKLAQIQEWQQKFTDRISDDLDMPGALAVVWDMLKDNIPDYDKVDLLLDWDQILGLNLAEARAELHSASPVPAEITELVKQRETARAQKDWAAADHIRQQIEAAGFNLEDTPSGTQVRQR